MYVLHFQVLIRLTVKFTENGPYRYNILIIFVINADETFLSSIESMTMIIFEPHCNSGLLC